MIKLFHRFLALIFRKFWTYCPKCLHYFGGHQKHYHHVKLDKHYRYVCHKCYKEAVL